MIFTDYWKEKAAKRRKSWVSKAKRFAEQHTQLEDIRKEVYLEENAAQLRANLPHEQLKK